MESITYLKEIKISPKKMRFMLPAVKKMSPNEGLDYLMYSPKKEAKIYYKALNSAIHNAMATLKVGADVLQFKVLTIEEGRALKRYKPGARGSAKPIKRKYSHIKIILVAEQAKAAASKPKKEVKKIEAPNTKKVPTRKAIAIEKKVEKVEKKSEVTQVKEVKKVNI